MDLMDVPEPGPGAGAGADPWRAGAASAGGAAAAAAAPAADPWQSSYGTRCLSVCRSVGLLSVGRSSVCLPDFCPSSQRFEK